MGKIKRKIVVAVFLAIVIVLYSCGANSPNNLQLISTESTAKSTAFEETISTTKAVDTSKSSTTNTTTTRTTITTTITTTTEKPKTSFSTTTASTTSSIWTESHPTTTLTTVTMPTLTTVSNITTTIITSTEAIQTMGIKPLPDSLQWCIDQHKAKYPNMKVGFGVFALDGSGGYGYNIDEPINGACTIKAPYALYIFNCCEQQHVDIWGETIQYQDWFYDTGSGDIKYVVDEFYQNHDKNKEKFQKSYCIGDLVNLLLSVSDNIAYKMLQTRFSLDGYREFLKPLNGQNLWQGQTFGQASVRQRMNEWLAIIKYINSYAPYANLLKNDLHNTRFCSLVIGMKRDHDYLHKSGWNDGTSYNSACDVAVIDNEYLVIVMTQDSTSSQTRNDVVNSMGWAIEYYVDAIGGASNLFK